MGGAARLVGQFGAVDKTQPLDDKRQFTGQLWALDVPHLRAAASAVEEGRRRHEIVARHRLTERAEGGLRATHRFYHLAIRNIGPARGLQVPSHLGHLPHCFRAKLPKAIGPAAHDYAAIVLVDKNHFPRGCAFRRRDQWHHQTVQQFTQMQSYQVQRGCAFGEQGAIEAGGGILDHLGTEIHPFQAEIKSLQQAPGGVTAQ